MSARPDYQRHQRDAGESVVSSYSYGIIGIRIMKSDLPRVVQHSCEHPARNGQKFCPECGVKVEVKSGDDEQTWDRFVEQLSHETELPEGFVFEHIQPWPHDYEVCFLGWGKASVDYRTKTAGIGGYDYAGHIPADVEIKQEIERLMEQTGWEQLFNPHTFGLHVYQYYS
jgi:hypothetical protein